MAGSSSSGTCLKRVQKRLKDLAQQREDLEATVHELREIEDQVTNTLAGLKTAAADTNKDS